MRVLPILLLVFATSVAHAEVPFQFAAPNLRAPDDPHVNGIRFTVIRGRNQSVRGVDLGLFSLSQTGDLTGFSSVLGVGSLTGDLRGCATGIVNLHDGTDRGLNLAFVNQIRRMDGGVNVGLVNLVDDYSTTDLGGMNLSDRSAVQIGVLNITKRLDGIQLGLLNLAENGFLPVFPFFNFPAE